MDHPSGVGLHGPALVGSCGLAGIRESWVVSAVFELAVGAVVSSVGRILSRLAAPQGDGRRSASKRPNAAQPMQRTGARNEAVSIAASMTNDP